MALTDEQCDKLVVMLQTSGWREVFLPIVAQRGQMRIKALCLPPGRREGINKDMSDEAIRGALEELEYVLSAFQNEVTVNRANRQRDELAGNGVGTQAQAP